MNRDDLYAFYTRHYHPGNATLVVVGDVDTDEVMRRAEHHFAHIPEGRRTPRHRVQEPPQLGERRVDLQREGTTAYLKFAWPAPAVRDRDFFPMLVLDAVMTGAKGLSLWAGFRGNPPQRKARLYKAIVDRGLASSVSGVILPTIDPFLYTVSFTANQGVSLAEIEDAATGEIERARTAGVTEAEVARAQRQLEARLVFETDSVTNVAHQIGYFETVTGPGFLDDLPARLAGVTARMQRRSSGKKPAPATVSKYPSW